MHYYLIIFQQEVKCCENQLFIYKAKMGNNRTAWADGNGNYYLVWKINMKGL